MSLIAPAICRADGPTTAPSNWPAAKTIDVDINKVSVRRYVDFLREQSGLNVVLVPDRGVDVEKLELPAIRLTHVSAGQALALVNSTPGAAVSIEENDDAEHGSKIYVVRIAQANRNQFGNETPPVPATIMTVFPLEKLLLGESPKDRILDDGERERALIDRAEQLLVLAEQTFAMVPPAGEKPELRYHAPTHTLLVKATEEDAKRVQKLIDALEVPEPPKGGGPADVAMLKANFEKLARLNQTLRDQADFAQRDADAFRKSIAAGLLIRVPSTQPFDPDAFPENGDVFSLTPEQHRAVVASRRSRGLATKPAE